MGKWSLSLLAIVAVAGACSDMPVEPTSLDVRSERAGEGRLGPAAGEPIADQYIVVFNESVRDVPGLARQLTAAHGRAPTFTYERTIRGFAAKLPQAAAEALAQNPNVAHVEEDRVVHATTTQPNAAWGLDRTDQRGLPLSGTYEYTRSGTGVTVYIVDTGLRFDHTDFGGRAASGYDAIDGGSADDCNGHGTHVAGTVGGTTHGVAKGVRLVGVRVLDCEGSGTLSGVIAGIDWVTANHVKPAVVNLSLGGGASTSLDEAVRRSIASGITYAVAAGNDAVDACWVSPARVPEAITVGATTSSDARASYSNYGSCLDIFAPGSDIVSAWHTGTTMTATISGTSMATPHVAGAAALFLESSPSAAPATVRDAIVGSASSNVVTSPGAGSPNRLLYALLTAQPASGGAGGTTAPCSSCTAYAGSLSGTGAYAHQPKGTYYQSLSGTHTGWLQGAAGTDFDLYLYKWNGWRWALVARSETVGSTEKIAYTGTSGYYLWEVYSYSGSGTYTFWLAKP